MVDQHTATAEDQTDDESEVVNEPQAPYNDPTPTSADEAEAEDQTQAEAPDADQSAEGDDMAQAAEEDMNIEIPDMSYDHLEKVKAAVIAKQREQRDRERAQDLNTVKGLVAKHGFKWNDLKAEKPATRKVAPKYRNPATGELWSGRGKAPLWIRDEADRTPFLITA